MAYDYFADLLDQPRAIRDTVDGLVASRALDRVAGLPRADSVVLTGMGSSHYALYGLYLRLLAAGRPATWIETSELLHHAAGGVSERTLLVVASQSGESIEAVRLLESLPSNVRVVGVTNHPESTLGRRADLPLPLAAGAEGIVANKTYVSTVATALLLGAALTGRDEPDVAGMHAAADALGELLGRRDLVAEHLTQALGERPSPLFLIGRGPSYGSALTGALMLKEGSSTAAEALSGGAVRHGPLEMVGAQTSALLLAPAGPGGELVRRLGAEMAGYGARVAVVGPEGSGAGPSTIATPPLEPSLAPLVEIAAAELLVAALARTAGREPGEFRRLGKVTREE